RESQTIPIIQDVLGRTLRVSDQFTALCNPICRHFGLQPVLPVAMDRASDCPDRHLHDDADRILFFTTIAHKIHQTEDIKRVIIVKNNDNPARPRGRPRSFDRAEVLIRAAETFWRLGYEGASITDLTTAMGITPQSFYAAFESKAALYRETIEWYLTTIGAFVPEILSKETHAPTAFRQLLERAAREFTKPGRPHGCMIATAALSCGEEHHELVTFVAAQRARTLKLLQMRAEKGVLEGDYPEKTDTIAIARYISALIQGLSVQAIDGAEEQELLSMVQASTTSSYLTLEK
ncbi:MAG: TetR/AcrR family transcriptional regulator, partial [Gluconacetobacter sp.]